MVFDLLCDGSCGPSSAVLMFARVAVLYLSPLLHSLFFSTFSSGEPGSAVERLEGTGETARRGGEGANSEACGGPGG